MNQKGSGFVNLQRLIGASNPSRLGAKLANNIRSNASDLKENVNQANNQFNQTLGLQTNQLATKKNLATGAMETVPSALTDENVKNYQDFMKSTVAPTPLNTAKTDALRSRSAQQIGMATNPYGQAELLRTVVNNPKYDTRKQQLDSMILQGDRQSQNDIRQAKRDAISSVSAADNLENQANMAQRNAQRSLKAQQDELRKRMEAETQALKDRAATTFDTERARYDAMFAEDPNLIRNQLMDTDTQRRISNIINPLDLTSGLVLKTPAEGTNQKFLTAEDMAKRNALARLSGMSPEEIANAREIKLDDIYGFDANKAIADYAKDGEQIQARKPAFIPAGQEIPGGRIEGGATAPVLGSPAGKALNPYLAEFNNLAGLGRNPVKESKLGFKPVAEYNPYLNLFPWLKK